MLKDNNRRISSDRDESFKDRDIYYFNKYPLKDVSCGNYTSPTRIVGERRNKKTYKKNQITNAL
jgi:hypothetical protein